MNSKTIAIIPARGGSKRLPGKNVLSLGGIPLLVHSIRYAQSNPTIIDEVYVSTDDAAIKEVALAFGAKVIDRPAALSGDFEPTLSSLQHVLKTIDEVVDTLVLLQPTNPLRPVDLLSQCFQVYLDRHLDSLFTVTQNHHKLGKIANDQFVPFNYELGQRSQDLEPLYFENGLLYITKATTILEGSIISATAYPFVVNDVVATVDIDTKEDFEYAEYIMHRK